jgi:hypothetical protein
VALDSDAALVIRSAQLLADRSNQKHHQHKIKTFPVQD